MTSRSPGDLVISLVGKSPAAPVTALRTWAKHEGAPAKVLLLETTETVGSGARVREALAPHSVDILPIASSLSPESGREAAPVVVARALEGHDPNQRVVFYADPGPKPQTVAVAAVLPRDSLLLFAEWDWLVCRRSEGFSRVGEYQLVDLLLPLWMDLHAAKTRSMAPRPAAAMKLAGVHLANRIEQALQFTHIGGRQVEAPALDLAYERAGKLYALQMIGLSSSQKPREEVRAIQALAGSLPSGGTKFSIASDLTSVRSRAEAARMNALSPNQSELCRWAERATASAEPLRRPPPVAVPAPVPGSGGTGLPLVVWLGTDPVVTLQSIATHQPAIAVVLYDASNSNICAAVERLRASAQPQGSRRGLPAGSITFAASNFFGDGAPAAALAALKNHPRIKVDVMPGTKPQALSISRLGGAELWSQDAGQGIAVRLDAEERPPLRVPDLLTIAYVCGGEHQEGIDTISDADRLGLRLLASAIARDISTGKKVSVADIPPDVAHRLPDGSLLVKDGDRTAHLSPEFTKQGTWLEWVTAGAFMDAGADEVRLGLNWCYPGSDDAKDDGDIVARMGSRLFVVESKSGRKPGTLARGRHQAETLARQGLGGYAIPIVVRPRIDAAIVARSIPNNAAILDLATLADPQRLKAFLDEAVRRRPRGQQFS